MTHQHHCDCRHDAVRYCATCKVCHCLNCGKEWRDANTYTPTWTYTTSPGPSDPPWSGNTCYHDAKG